ncbi:MAG: prolipoprotein diacylglyceryl transferase [Lachnospiraceae bacterium]|nr:prolipoprotein diacylglyceryl transferase [Lachnospiraceae bacterium]
MAIDLFTIGSFTIHGYGLMIGIGFMVAVLVGSWRCDHQLKLSGDDFSTLAILVLVFCFVGGKILFTIVEFKSFLQNPLSVISSSGFVVYGGIFSGVLTIYLFCKIKKVSFLSYLDAIVPSVALNQGFGRLGCFMAGCCYGRETTSHFSVVFPENSLAPAGVHLIPTQLYSAAFDLLLGVVMIVNYRKFKRRGDVAVMYFGCYAIGRFIIEFFRNDERGAVGALSTSQFISILMLAFSVALYFINKKLNLKPSWMEDTGAQDTEAETETAAAEV